MKYGIAVVNSYAFKSSATLENADKFGNARGDNDFRQTLAFTKRVCADCSRALGDIELFKRNTTVKYVAPYCRYRIGKIYLF